MSLHSKAEVSAIPELLPHRMHDFTRCSWVSDEARATWEPRIRRITEMLFEVEWRAIAVGLRRCALRSISAGELEQVRGQLSQFGIVVEPLQGIVLRSNYSSSLEPCTNGAPTAFWCALGREPDVAEISRSYRENDQKTIGELLGYPSCCIDFFQRTWVEASLVDTTWPMAAGSASGVIRGGSTIEIPNQSMCGMQLRWLGVRTVFHLPCSFECASSLQMAAAHLELAKQCGFVDESQWLAEMLRWPVEWSALHGIAEVRTPVAKVVTRTDATPGKYIVRYLGDPFSLPKESGAGLVFPFQRPATLSLTQSRGFHLGLANPIKPISADNEFVHAPWYPRDNGFTTRYAMDRSHAPIVDRAKRLLLESPVGDGPSRVVDLGCGNGALVRKIVRLCSGLAPGGVDRDPEKTSHARLLNPAASEKSFVVADLFDDTALACSDECYLVILMLGRLVEVPAEVFQDLLMRLHCVTKHLLVYAYDDYIAQFGSLAEMAERVGIELLDGNQSRTVQLAQISRAMLTQKSSIAEGVR